MKAVTLMGAVAALAILSGCYRAPVMPPLGYIFSDVSAQIDTDAEQTPVTTGSGEAESASVLGLVAWGDASTTTAASNGGLSTVEHVDYKYFNVLGIYQTFTTVAYGN
ncbi:MAG: TRL-like family protein [Candidatus Sumerlaeia bacterium]|nr:TRL-like family protein [Candidatus Sumerlaeia bacterium]